MTYREWLSKMDNSMLAAFLDVLKCCNDMDCEQCICSDYCIETKENHLTTEQWLLEECD